MRICIFGAGAIGGFVAAHLAQVGGLEVSVVARGAHRMSMLQDWQRGRPLEVDVLTDSVAAMRTLAGIATPTIDEVYGLLRLRAENASAAR